MSETTHLICAQCGGDVAISNSQEQPTVKSEYQILTFYKRMNSLMFKCPNCGTQYPLPVVILENNHDQNNPSSSL